MGGFFYGLGGPRLPARKGLSQACDWLGLRTSWAARKGLYAHFSGWG